MDKETGFCQEPRNDPSLAGMKSQIQDDLRDMQKLYVNVQVSMPPGPDDYEQGKSYPPAGVFHPAPTTASTVSSMTHVDYRPFRALGAHPRSPNTRTAKRGLKGVDIQHPPSLVDLHADVGVFFHSCDHRCYPSPRGGSLSPAVGSRSLRKSIPKWRPHDEKSAHHAWPLHQSLVPEFRLSLYPPIDAHRASTDNANMTRNLVGPTGRIF
jgi:hypothetical protein